MWIPVEKIHYRYTWIIDTAISKREILIIPIQNVCVWFARWTRRVYFFLQHVQGIFVLYWHRNWPSLPYRCNAYLSVCWRRRHDDISLASLFPRKNRFPLSIIWTWLVKTTDVNIADVCININLRSMVTNRICTRWRWFDPKLRNRIMSYLVWAKLFVINYVLSNLIENYFSFKTCEY